MSGAQKNGASKLPIRVQEEMVSYSRAILDAADAMEAYRQWSEKTSKVSAPYVQRMTRLRAEMRALVRVLPEKGQEESVIKIQKDYEARIEEVRAEMREALIPYPKPRTGGQIISKAIKKKEHLWCSLVSAAIRVDRVRRGKAEFSEART